MAQLILCTAEGLELVRRPMEPSERYALYRLFSASDYLEHAGRCYRLLSVAWKLPEEDCICRVRDEGYIPVTAYEL
jgi:hypothetical protein